MIGARRRTWSGAACSTKCTWRTWQGLSRCIADAAADRRGWTDVELRLFHVGGRFVTMQGCATPVLDPSGQLAGFRGASRAAPVESADRLRYSGVRYRTRELIDSRSMSIAL